MRVRNRPVVSSSAVYLASRCLKPLIVVGRSLANRTTRWNNKSNPDNLIPLIDKYCDVLSISLSVFCFGCCSLIESWAAVLVSLKCWLARGAAEALLKWRMNLLPSRKMKRDIRRAGRAQLRDLLCEKYLLPIGETPQKKPAHGPNGRTTGVRKCTITHNAVSQQLIYIPPSDLFLSLTKI